MLVLLNIDVKSLALLCFATTLLRATQIIIGRNSQCPGRIYSEPLKLEQILYIDISSPLVVATCLQIKFNS